MTYYDKDVNINNKSQPSMIKLDYVTIKIAIIAKKKFLSVMQLPYILHKSPKIAFYHLNMLMFTVRYHFNWVL